MGNNTKRGIMLTEVVLNKLLGEIKIVERR